MISPYYLILEVFVIARKCKCQVTGEWGNTDIFYKVTNKKGRNKYYKTKEIYNKYIKEKESQEKLLKYIAIEILDYDQYRVLPPILLKKIKEIHKVYNYEVILETFQQNRDTLNYWMNLEDKFENEFQRVSYMMAIINNNIIDIYKEWKRKQSRKKKETNVDVNILSKDIKHSNKNKKDISDFL